MEVEIPATALRALFKGERSVGFGWRHAFLEDLLKQNLIRSGRTAHEGPSIEWLLVHAHEYLSRAIADVTNGVISSYRREYGGESVGYVNEEALQRAMLVFARRQDASVTLHSINFQPTQNFQLKGEWRKRPITPAAIELNRQLNTDEALLRIRALLEFGFPLEAMSVANAYLEMVALALAFALTAGNLAAEEAARVGGYALRIDIIDAAARAEPQGHVAEALQKFATTARAIYPHRNDYMHNLRSRDHDYSRTVDLERQARQLLDVLLDHFFGRIWLGHLAAITNGTSNIGASAIMAAQLKANSPRS